MLKRMAAALLLIGSPAAAGEGAAQFSIGGVALEAAVPNGYCLPSAEQAGAVRTLAAGDDRNVTHLTLVSCPPVPGEGISYVLFKTPKEAVGATLDLAQFLQDAGAAFESPEFNAMVGSGEMLAESEASMGKALGSEIDLSGELRPLGKDERCAYLGGTMQVKSGTADYRVSVGMCMTVVAGRLLTINWYGPDKGSAGVAELLVKAKRLAGNIKGQPAS